MLLLVGLHATPNKQKTCFLHFVTYYYLTLKLVTILSLFDWFSFSCLFEVSSFVIGNIAHSTLIFATPNNLTYKGVTLAQLVKASVGQADVQRFEPRLRHN